MLVLLFILPNVDEQSQFIGDSDGPVRGAPNQHGYSGYSSGSASVCHGPSELCPLGAYPNIAHALVIDANRPERRFPYGQRKLSLIAPTP